VAFRFSSWWPRWSCWFVHLLFWELFGVNLCSLFGVKLGVPAASEQKFTLRESAHL
jgi:hypothetical protein